MSTAALSPLEEGLIVGLLIGEGHFGGDGRKPQVTLRMHVRHESLLRWLEARVPGSRLYGPYHHGDRHYLQWMVRGPALVEHLLPVRERHVADSLVALEIDAVRAARRIADIGSGAGWPGLALAAALPEARVTLVESAVRHSRYLEKAVAA